MQRDGEKKVDFPHPQLQQCWGTELENLQSGRNLLSKDIIFFPKKCNANPISILVCVIMALELHAALTQIWPQWGPEEPAIILRAWGREGRRDGGMEELATAAQPRPDGDTVGTERGRGCPSPRQLSLAGHSRAAAGPAPFSSRSKQARNPPSCLSASVSPAPWGAVPQGYNLKPAQGEVSVFTSVP